MAATQQQRSAKSAAKRKERGTEDLRLRVCKGEKDWLLQLMDWTKDTEQGSVMAGCLRHVHSLGREGAIEALRSRHKIEVNENVAAELYAIGQRQASRLDAEEA
ncbi:hypothetical protein [Pseudomonas poae]|uniref:Uncharacterized protein n=1 Tax=Pseudomonas poae TaxID=200451 RepID=A0A2S9EUG8_9PSED|nr:hypothetical protein [Pseudomonas poae]PRA33770.1 hypothetical protein CQZ97_00760 [Pseudomonas poae]PRC19640.1 hypothetical protein CQZ99_09845 [Pseudomonas poae]